VAQRFIIAGGALRNPSGSSRTEPSPVVAPRVSEFAEATAVARIVTGPYS